MARLVILPLAAASNSGRVGAATSCVPMHDNPYATTSTLVSARAASDVIAWRAAGGIFMRSSSATLELATDEFVFPPPSTSCVFLSTPLGGGSAVRSNPAFGVSFDLVGSDILVVGSPNKDLTVYMNSTGANELPKYAAQPVGAQSYSAISVVLIDETSRTTTVKSTIESFATPLLGSLLSADGDSVATVYDASTVVIYSPLINRTDSSFSSSSDRVIDLPADFMISALSLRGHQLVVAGRVFVSEREICIPKVLIYATSPSSGGEWILMSSSTLFLHMPLESGNNAMDCSAVVTVALSDDGSAVLSAVDSWSAVFLAQAASFNTTLQLNRATESVFGSSIAFISATGTEFVAATTSAAFTFSATAWRTRSANPLALTSLPGAHSMAAFASSSLPNPSQFTTGNVAVMQVAAIPFVTVAYVSGNPPLLVSAHAPAGYFFNPRVNEFEPCPAGTFKAMPSGGPCAPCPLGSYAAHNGTVSCAPCGGIVIVNPTDFYCPVGSSALLDHEIWNAERSEYLPEFEASSSLELFEELLVATIFDAHSVPMIIMYAILCFTFVLFLCTVCKCSPALNSWAYWFLAVYRFIDLPEMESEELAFIAHKVEKHLEWHTVHGGNDGKTFTDVPKHSNEMRVLRGDAVDKPSGADDGEYSDVASPQAEHRHQHEEEEQHTIEEIAKEKTLEDPVPSIVGGFFNIILLLFFISAFAFSGKFLNSYDAYAVRRETDPPINRVGVEELRSLANVPAENALGLAAINEVNATFVWTLYGSSAFECSIHNVIAIHFDGCQLIGTPALCNDTQYWKVNELIEPENTCEIRLEVPRRSIFSPIATVELVLPVSFTAAAIKYSFLQNAQDAAEVEETNQYAIGSTQFHDMVLHPISDNGTLVENYFAPLIQREWSFGVLLSRAQDATSPPHFFARYYTSVASLLAPVFPYYTKEQSAMSTSDAVRLRTVCYTDSYYRTQTYQRLIQPEVAFLTLLLSLIAIFHLVKLAHESIEVVYVLHVRFKQRMARKAAEQATVTTIDEVADRAVVPAGGKKVQDASSHSGIVTVHGIQHQ